MKNPKLPNLVTILILTLITAVMWIGFNIYRAFTSGASPSVPQVVSAALTPTLDTNTINKIESALYFSESQIPEINITTTTPAPVSTVAPTAIPTSTPEASSSATPQATASATPVP